MAKPQDPGVGKDAYPWRRAERSRNSQPAPNVTSPTPDSSPSDTLGETKIRRSLVKIPSTQKELLTGYESWATFLSRRPNGFINVPPEVLDIVKAAYTRHKKPVELNHAVESSGHAGNNGDAPEPSGSQSSPLPRVQENDDAGGDDNENADDQLSWSASPEPQRRSLRFDSQEPSQEQSQPFMTQLPQESPPQPTIMTSLLEHSKLPDFPQSSQGPEDELEVEVPAALTYNLMPINKSALPMRATPPSAQVVPCTFEQSTQSGSTDTSKNLDPQPKPKTKNHIYNRVPELYRGPKTGTISSHLRTNADPNKAVAVPVDNANAESSLSTNDASSSIIPSTTNKIEKHKRISDVKPGKRLTYSGPISDNLNSSSGLESSSPAKMASVPPRDPRSPQELVSTAHNIAQPTVASKSWEAPFAHYTVTYPDYDGTIHDFIMACIYIQLQHRRIRTSLHDDFIRAWVAGYLPYVKDCDGAHPPRKALRAIDWYNQIDEDPLFTSRVVTRQNLESIINFYPAELETARIALGMFSSQASSEQSISNGLEVSYAQQSHIQQPSRNEPIRKTVEAPVTENETSKLAAAPKPKLSPHAIDQQIPAHKSFGGVNTRPAQHKGLTRSLSESTMHRKRLATNDLRSEGTKRISLGLTPDTRGKLGSDSGSTVSNHSERSKKTARSSLAPGSTSRKEGGKNAEDPEEQRRRRLAKHFKKRLAGRESIASSAPVSNAPASGQQR
ncbi:hypothetical protein F4678DRAFT_469016 [Xylaria arbuscula]|nr:hypothetical protein F4678DRAFT_469016 [Xylaria arbuscula]